uniref:Uncharacterized protein n=1 Tax=Anguilla anguilla TaxID=7936 RepID=A0A0E9WVX8_ANGAN
MYTHTINKIYNLQIIQTFHKNISTFSQGQILMSFTASCSCFISRFSVIPDGVQKGPQCTAILLHSLPGPVLHYIYTPVQHHHFLHIGNEHHIVFVLPLTYA